MQTNAHINKNQSKVFLLFYNTLLEYKPKIVPEEKQGIKTFPLDLRVSQTNLQKSPIIGSGIRVGAWVRPVIIIQSAFWIDR